MTCPPHKWEFSEIHNCGSDNVHNSCLVAVVKCRKCGVERGPSWIERRLNASEALTAEDARSISQELYEIYEERNETEEHLNEYARLRGGE